MRCLLAAFLAAGMARAQEPGHWSIGLGASAKADYPNPLTTTLLYFPFSLRAALEWTKDFRVRGSIGYGTIFGDETSGSTFEALVAPEAQVCGWLACASARVDVGFSSSSYRWRSNADIRAVLVEPAFAFRFPGETRFGFGFELGWRFKLPVWRRIEATGIAGTIEGNQNGPLLGLFLDLRL
jgi:hypothetical protein